MHELCCNSTPIFGSRLLLHNSFREMILTRKKVLAKKGEELVRKSVTNAMYHAQGHNQNGGSQYRRLRFVVHLFYGFLQCAWVMMILFIQIATPIIPQRFSIQFIIGLISSYVGQFVHDCECFHDDVLQLSFRCRQVRWGVIKFSKSFLNHAIHIQPYMKLLIMWYWRSPKFLLPFVIGWVPDSKPPPNSECRFYSIFYEVILYLCQRALNSTFAFAARTMKSFSLYIVAVSCSLLHNRSSRYYWCILSWRGCLLPSIQRAKSLPMSHVACQTNGID